MGVVVIFEEFVFKFWICTCFADGKLSLVIKTLVADLVTTLFELKFELFEEVVDITGNEFDVF